MIYGAVKEQKLVIRADAVADTIDYLTAKFTFMSQDWEGLTIYAHFKSGDKNYSVQLAEGAISEEDHLNLSAGEWEVYLHGNEYRNGDVIKRITTNVCSFTVTPTGILNGEPFPEADPSVVEELAAQVADHEERIEVLESSSSLNDYEELENKPRINDFELVGNVTSSDIGIPEKGEIEPLNEGYVTGGDVYTALSGKQNTLTAGTNITIQNDVISAASGGDAEDITYDNTTSGLIADDVQAAIDELNTNKADSSDLATVATSGDYDDLSNKPTIPDPQIQADWNEADSTKADFIKNKPRIPQQSHGCTQGDFGYLTGDDGWQLEMSIEDSYISENITYDNTDSGLTATDVQAAIDELAQGGGGFVVSDTAPSDTSVLWIDTSDNTIDETLANGDTSSY